ncbi:MAG: hypothetical protein M9916_04495 [Crocinitomicaceae bacterium]|nr:hypothetical protein [Crocinitomicaceae bacterium]
MNKFLFTFMLLSLVTFNGFSQNFVPLVYDTLERSQEINLFASGEFGSTAISTKLSKHFLFGGEISQSTIEKIDGKQKSLNRIGFYTDPTIEYINYKVKPFKKKDWGIVVKAGLFYSGAARYRKGAFGLLFRGNEPYLGKQVDLSNMVAGITAAHKIGFGFIDNKTKSSVTLNIYGITNYINFYSNETSLYQDNTGFDAKLMLDGKGMVANMGPFYKGLGVGFDANLFFKVGREEKLSYLQVSFQNLGIGFINKNISSYEMDTTIYYDGYTFSDIINGGTIFGKGKNIADEIGLKRDTVSKVIALPFTFQIGKIIDEHNTKKFQLFYGGKVYVMNGALPMVYIGGHYRSNKWFRMGLGLSYGGFSGIRANVYLQGVWKQFNVGIATSDLVGIIGLGNGYGASINLNYRFN